MAEKSYLDRMAERYAARYPDVEPAETLEEREQRLRGEYLARSKTQFHSDFDFDRAVEALEKFDEERWTRYRYPIPGETRQYGDQRIYFKVFDNVWKAGSDSVSISLLMEESPRFGVDVTAIVSDMHFEGVGDVVMDAAVGGTENRYFNELKRQLGVDVPSMRKALVKKIKDQLGLGEK